MVVRPEAPPLTVEHYKNLPGTGPQYQLIEGDLQSDTATSPLLPGLVIALEEVFRQ